MSLLTLTMQQESDFIVQLKARCEVVQASLARVSELAALIERPLEVKLANPQIVRRQNELISEYNRIMIKAAAVVNHRYAQCLIAAQHATPASKITK